MCVYVSVCCESECVVKDMIYRPIPSVVKLSLLFRILLRQNTADRQYESVCWASLGGGDFKPTAYCIRSRIQRSLAIKEEIDVFYLQTLSFAQVIESRE